MTRAESLILCRAVHVSKSARQTVLACVEAEPWSTSREIADELGLPLATVSSHLAAMWRDGRLERSGTARAYAYRVTHAEGCRRAGRGR